MGGNLLSAVCVHCCGSTISPAIGTPNSRSMVRRVFMQTIIPASNFAACGFALACQTASAKAQAANPPSTVVSQPLQCCFAQRRAVHDDHRDRESRCGPNRGGALASAL